MGRSFDFDFDKDVKFPCILPSSDILSKLVKGQLVTLTIGPKTKDVSLCRSVSTYYYQSSSTKVVLVVDDIDYCKEFNKYNFRCIVFRDPKIAPENHIYAWCVTTDGFERETEHYGISGEILDVNIVGNTTDSIQSTISALSPGKLIKLETKEIPQEYSLPYTPSILPEDSTSDIHSILVVDWIRDGLIALREPSIPPENHVYFWYLRTDGIIVECDIYEPLYKLTNITIV